MNFFRKTTLLLSLTLMVMSVCAQKLEQYIPKDASFVMSMDLANLDSKVSFEQLKKFDFYKDMKKEMDKEMNSESEQEFAKLINDPSAYGIDIMKKSYVFSEMNEEGSLFGFIFNISDQKKFNQFFKETVVPEAKGVMGKMGKFQTLTTKEATFAWQDNVGIVLGGEPKMSMAETAEDEVEEEEEPMFEDNTVEEAEDAAKESTEDVMADIDAYLLNRDVKRDAMVAAFTKKIVNAKATNSIVTNPRYLKATKGKKNDMTMFMDYEWIMDMQMGETNQQMQAMGMGGMMDAMKELYKDTDYLMNLNFNKGAIVMDSEMYSNKETMERMRKMSTGELNKDFFKYLPNKDMMGYFSLALNTKNFADGLFEMFNPMLAEANMTRAQMEDMALQTVNSMGIELDREGLYEIIRGDMIFAVTGLQEFTVKKTQYDEDFNPIEIESKQKLPEFTFMMSYGKEKELMKMIGMGVDAGALAKDGNAYKIAIPIPDVPMDMYLSLNDGVMFFTNNKELAVGKWAKGYGKANRITPVQQKMMKENSGAFFWDIPLSLNAFMEVAGEAGAKDKEMEKMVNMAKETFKSMVFTTSKDMKDSYKSEFKLNFNKANTNSLEQLFDFVNKVYVASKNSGSM